MANATEKYLEPLDPKKLGDAILRVTIPVSTTGKKPDHFIIEVYDLQPVTQANGTVALIPSPPFSHIANTFVERRFQHGVKRLERKNVYHPIYSVPITDYSVQLILNVWTGKREISPVARPFMQAIFLREAEAEFNAQRYYDYMQHGKVPTNSWHTQHSERLSTKGLALNPYQRTFAYNAIRTRAYCLRMDPGTGKTCVMIAKMDYLIDTSTRETKTLILCPKNIRTNWRNEIQKFSVNTDKICIVEVDGASSVDREIHLITAVSDPDSIGKHLVFLCGYESYVNTERLQEWEFDLCLLDESQNIANPHTKRTRTILENREKFHNAIDATGTFFRNSPFDAFTQLEFLGEGYSGHTSYAEFKQFYGQYAQGYNGKATLQGFQRIPLMQERLAKHTCGITFEQALPHIPARTYSIIESSLTTEQGKVYAQMAEYLCAEIETYEDEPDAVTVNNILTKLLRLAQITSGFVTMDSGLVNLFDPNPKLDLLVRLLKGSDDSDEDDLPGILSPTKKALVWCCFVQNIATIRARLLAEGINCVTFSGKLDREEKDDAVEQFNCNRDVSVFIGTPASGGVGLNLVGFDPNNSAAYDTNCTDVINFSSNWSYDKREQSLKRAHRFITRVPVHITDLLVPRSIDTEIYARLELKKEMSATIQDVRSILANILSRSPLLS